jgi:hypothetical protein
MYTETHTKDQMRTAYGSFAPGSAARDLRTENARRGYRTCWHCLDAFKPRRVLDGDGHTRRVGRGRWFCSRSCADADRARRPPVAQATDDPDLLVLDLRRCRGCAA